MITSTFKITKPENADCTVEITMTLGEWKRLRNNLSESYPDWKIGIVLQRLIEKAESTIESTGTFNDPT